MKSARQEKILEIIDKYEVSTQEALIAKLAEFGFESTQTTISRDIRQLKLVKTPTGRGTYKYAAPKEKRELIAPAHNSALTDSVIKIEAAQNIVVIKTLSGMANAIAVCLDTVDIGSVVGSVAGDDTILLVMKDSERAEESERALKALFS